MDNLTLQQIENLPTNNEGLFIKNYGNETITQQWINFLNNSGSSLYQDKDGLFSFYALKFDKHNVYYAKLYKERYTHPQYGNCLIEIKLTDKHGNIINAKTKYVEPNDQAILDGIYTG